LVSELSKIGWTGSDQRNVGDRVMLTREWFIGEISGVCVECMVLIRRERKKKPFMRSEQLEREFLRAKAKGKRRRRREKTFKKRCSCFHVLPRTVKYLTVSTLKKRAAVAVLPSCPGRQG